MIVVIGSEYYAEPFRHLDKIESVHGLNNEIWENPKEIALVMFTGGSDVHPSFYKGRDNRSWCMTNIERDKLEKTILEFCMNHNIKMKSLTI